MTQILLLFYMYFKQHLEDIDCQERNLSSICVTERHARTYVLHLCGKHRLFFWFSSDFDIHQLFQIATNSNGFGYLDWVWFWFGLLVIVVVVVRALAASSYSVSDLLHLRPIHNVPTYVNWTPPFFCF
jgi:hypothetical protein